MSPLPDDDLDPGQEVSGDLYDSGDYDTDDGRRCEDCGQRKWDGHGCDTCDEWICNDCWEEGHGERCAAAHLRDDAS